MHHTPEWIDINITYSFALDQYKNLFNIYKMFNYTALVLVALIHLPFILLPFRLQHQTICLER